MKGSEEILLLLKNKGLKVTKYRVAVLDLMSKKKKPLSVEEIIDYLGVHGLEPNKTTIYREMEVLSGENCIVKLNLGENKTRFELASLDHHHHLICNKCSTIEDIQIKDDVKDLERKISRAKKFKVLHHSLEFYGLCYRCR